MRWTEKEIENWLVLDQRLIRHPDNKAVELAQSNLFWSQFDYLRDLCFISDEEIVLLGIQTQRELALPFSLGIQDAVAHAYNYYFEKFGKAGCSTPYHRKRRVIFSVQSHYLDHDPESLAAEFLVACLADGSGIH